VTSKTPSGAQDDQEGVRGKILAVALHRFARAGYGKTSIKDIATEAGVTPGAVYHYFGSKPELYRQAGKLATGRVIDAYRQMATASAGKSQRARVQALFEAISAMVYEHEDNHWIGISIELDAARYPSVAAIRDEWAHDLQHLYQLVGERSPDQNDSGWDRDPLSVLMGVFTLGSGCVVVRDGPDALRVALRGLQRFLAEPADGSAGPGRPV
jgi:AcrR family transcriptional regulator